jgi:hypothetical protein
MFPLLINLVIKANRMLNILYMDSLDFYKNEKKKE